MVDKRENKLKVLLVDDDRKIRFLMSKELPRMGFLVECSSTGKEAVKKFREESFDIVLLDLKMPDTSGIEVLREMKQIDSMTEIIMLTGHASIDTAIEAMKLGAYDYLTKPCKLSEIDVILRKAGEKKNIKKENIAFKRVIGKGHALRQIIAQSRVMQSIIDAIKKAAPTDAPVLIEGESGTGKELIAHAIHQLSHRADNPLIIINCGSIQEALLESELFGHAKGAFTGAIERKLGLCEVADRGTLFLDEIAEMNLASQAKLLRMIQSGEIRRLGDNRMFHTDLRIIVATNKDLFLEISRGNFREDLYYRLNLVYIKIPPLRERKEDIPLLARYFLSNSKVSGKRKKEISEDALQILIEYNWPGNIRELENTIERFCIFIDDETITPENLIPHFQWNKTPPEGREKGTMDLFQLEKNHILKILSYCEGNKTKAADLLGITVKTLYNKIKSYDLSQQN